MKLMAFEMASVPVRRLLHDAVERVLHPRDRLLVQPVHLQRPRHRQHHNAVQLLEGGMMRRLFGGVHIDPMLMKNQPCLTNLNIPSQDWGTNIVLRTKTPTSESP